MDSIDLRGTRLKVFCNRSKSRRVERRGKNETADESSGSSGVAAPIRKREDRRSTAKG
jgi:hypothetical protein